MPAHKKGVAMAQTNPPKASSLGIFLSDATFPLAEFQQLSGLGEAALRKSRWHGLVVMAIGATVFRSRRARLRAYWPSGGNQGREARLALKAAVCRLWPQ